MSESKMSREPRFPREFPGVNYYGKEEEEAVLRVIRSRSPFRYYGASFLHEAENLENEMKQRLGRQYAQAVSSGTNGLTVALSALGVGPGQEVLIPGFLWVATATGVNCWQPTSKCFDQRIGARIMHTCSNENIMLPQECCQLV